MISEAKYHFTRTPLSHFLIAVSPVILHLGVSIYMETYGHGFNSRGYFPILEWINFCGSAVLTVHEWQKGRVTSRGDYPPHLLPIGTHGLHPEPFVKQQCQLKLGIGTLCWDWRIIDFFAFVPTVLCHRNIAEWLASDNMLLSVYCNQHNKRSQSDISHGVICIRSTPLFQCTTESAIDLWHDHFCHNSNKMQYTVFSSLDLDTLV